MSRSHRKSNVPADVTAFVGRADELRKIRDLLGGTRLLSLVGVGGVGKTRLALAAARDLRRAFTDGVWYVDLTAVHDGEFLEQAIRNVVPGVSGARSLVDQIGDADLLLVLDDCEHVISAVRTLVGDVLPWCPGVRILTTTRLPLGLAGEHLLTVPPLRVTASPGGAPSEAAELFIGHAAAVTGERPESLDRAAVDELCGRLDGLPLAIELAAMKARTMAVRDMIHGLDDRFSLLRGGPLDSHPRHQSLDAVLRWSWDLCDEAERDLWVRFAIFVGSVTVDAIVDVCGYADDYAAHDVVDRLVQRSLLVRDTIDGVVRFRMLDTIREFGLRMVEERAAVSGPDAATAMIRRRHLEHYCASVATAGSVWFGPQQRPTSHRVAANMPNLRLAFDRALADETLVHHAGQLYADLWVAWVGSGQVNEGGAWGTRLFERLAAVGIAPTCRARWIRGWVAIIAGDIDGAVTQLETCLREAPERGTPQDEYMSRGLLGGCRAIRGAFAVAREDYEHAIEQARAAGDAFGTAMLLQNLAELNGAYGDGDTALELCDAAERICREQGDRWFLSHVLWVRSIVGYRQGRLDAAWAHGLDALALTTMRDQLGIALIGDVLGWIAAARGEHRSAALMLGAADTYWRAAGCALYGIEPLVAFRQACLDDVRAALGGTRLTAALAQGAELGLGRLDRIARGEPLAAPARRRSDPDDTGGIGTLTRRELEIARLVADGMTNKEIATTLVIGHRTVDTHVAHILAKLNCGRRTEVARTVALADGRA
ncbi:MAG: LuxR C-terminal-related transcriptional regulator [Solirubrobacteraceae bacterium]